VKLRRGRIKNIKSGFNAEENKQGVQQW